MSRDELRGMASGWRCFIQASINTSSEWQQRPASPLYPFILVAFDHGAFFPSKRYSFLLEKKDERRQKTSALNWLPIEKKKMKGGKKIFTNSATAFPVNPGQSVTMFPFDPRPANHAIFSIVFCLWSTSFPKGLFYFQPIIWQFLLEFGSLVWQALTNRMAIFYFNDKPL